jgi:hypothetical protein
VAFAKDGGLMKQPIEYIHQVRAYDWLQCALLLEAMTQMDEQEAEGK